MSCASSASCGSTRAARQDPNIDRSDMYRTNYEATKLAIQRAMNNEPTVES